MRQFLMLIILVLAQLCPAASPEVKEKAKSLCLMVRAELGNPDRGGANATGTGFLIAPDLVLTCNHLTQIPFGRRMVPAERVYVEISRGKLIPAKILRRDLNHDLALLRLREPVRQEGFRIGDYSMQRGDGMTIIGNFPDALRAVQGKLLTHNLMPGFAMGSAKVRSGFSGGPILDSGGNVQGILSQRDDANNSIFVRTDVIRSLLRAHERATGEKLACLREAQPPAPEPAAVETVIEDAQPATGADDDRVVVAVPVRKTGSYARKAAATNP
jgi:S1-C subfamily serine protease